MTESGDQNIRSLFSRADVQRNIVEGSRDPNSDIFRENLASAIATYEECRVLADRLSLFSQNETLEDIPTGDIQYLLIDYRIGDLLSLVSADRKYALSKAREAYERYLGLLGNYEILSGTDSKLYHEYQDDPNKFSTVSTTDFGARRAAKIANFQREKDLKKKLEFLERNPAYLEKDDDAVRELQLTNVNLCTHNTFQALESINREMEVLALAPPPGERHISSVIDARERRGQQDGYSDRLDRPEIFSGGAGPMLSKDGKPLRPFTLLDSRQTIQNGVFRPGHNLPTMTIDEYLEEERARGGIIEGGGAASEVVPEPDEDNYEKGEQETLKAREWDEYVEANPKGSGNTLNRG